MASAASSWLVWRWSSDVRGPLLFLLVMLSSCADNEAEVLRPGGRADAQADVLPRDTQAAPPRDAGSPPEREVPRDGGDTPRDGREAGM
jgi:hypothetical protein